MTAAVKQKVVQVRHIRHPSDAEMRLVKASWSKAWAIRQRDATRGRVPWGVRRSMTRGTARRMHGAFIDAVATPKTCLVFVAPSEMGDDEVLSWCCRELIERDGAPHSVALHFVYTIKAARRRGLARHLLRYVRQEAHLAGGLSVHATHITGTGQALFEASA